MGDITEIEKQQASTWFRSLRDQIVSAFETLESAHATGPFAEAPIGQFDVTETKLSSEDGSDAGGGLMSVMRNGRVFEKVGVNVSTVYGQLGAEGQKAMAARMGIPGMQEDPRLRSLWRIARRADKFVICFGCSIQTFRSSEVRTRGV